MIVSPQHQGDLGKGFRKLGLDDHMKSVLEEMSDYTALIDAYLHATTPVPEISAMIDRRNSVQHALTSLPAANGLRETQSGFIALYEPIRLTMLIYSLGVIFPLPPMKGTHRKLVLLLKIAFEAMDSYEQAQTPVILWVLTLGGIAALGMLERRWFVKELSRLLATSPVYRVWQYAVEEFHSYLWLDSACEPGGRLLWDEVTQESSFDRFNLSQ